MSKRRKTDLQACLIKKFSEEMPVSGGKWTPAAIFHMLPDGELIMVDRSLIGILGFKDDKELLGKNISTLYHNRQQKNDELFSIFEKEQNESCLNTEVFWARKDGSPISKSLSVHPIRDKINKIEYYEGYVKEISVRKVSGRAGYKSVENGY